MHFLRPSASGPPSSNRQNCRHMSGCTASCVTGSFRRGGVRTELAATQSAKCLGPNTHSSNEDEAILAAFVADLEKSKPNVVDEYSGRYPHLADEFRALASTNHLLDRARPAAESQEPKCLGEFRIVRRLARGGMGEIYEA